MPIVIDAVIFGIGFGAGVWWTRRKLRLRRVAMEGLLSQLHERFAKEPCNASH